MRDPSAVCALRICCARGTNIFVMQHNALQRRQRNTAYDAPEHIIVKSRVFGMVNIECV